MTLGRTTAGINNTDCRYGERVDQVRRCVAASLSDDGVQLARISWLDPLEVWPESHSAGFALRLADVLQPYLA